MSVPSYPLLDSADGIVIHIFTDSLQGENQDLSDPAEFRRRRPARRRLMVFRMPAHSDVVCPKCHNSNAPGQAHILQVADGTGPYFDCQVCSHVWKDET